MLRCSVNQKQMRSICIYGTNSKCQAAVSQNSTQTAVKRFKNHGWLPEFNHDTFQRKNIDPLWFFWVNTVNKISTNVPCLNSFLKKMLLSLMRTQLRSLFLKSTVLEISRRTIFIFLLGTLDWALYMVHRLSVTSVLIVIPDMLL